jgi:hypothetical protein
VTDTNVFQLSQPGAFADPLTEVLRNGARALLTQAVEAEVAALLSSHADKLTADGRQRLVRHGYFEREIMTGIGPVAVRCPRVRDRPVRFERGTRWAIISHPLWDPLVREGCLGKSASAPLQSAEHSWNEYEWSSQSRPL